MFYVARLSGLWCLVCIYYLLVITKKVWLWKYLQITLIKLSEMKQLNKLLRVEIFNLILNKVDLNDFDPIMVAMLSRHSVMECVIVMS